ncbi:MAG: hypothetical protein AAF717_09350 [Bacteroidota bacterium]
MRTYIAFPFVLRCFALCLLLGSGIVTLSCSSDEEFSELLEISDDENDNDETQDDANNDDTGGPDDGMDNTDNDENSDEDSSDDADPTNECPAAIGFVFEETGGIISIEFEDNTFPEGWVVKSDGNGTSGTGYMQWEGDPKMNAPGNGTIVFPVRISQPGTYRFIWNSSFRKGDNGTEHNDSWLRFPDADDFFGRKNDGSVVYPNGSGKTPNPNGSSSDNWFKIYRSGNDDTFKWQASTSDHDAHNIYVTFESAGVYRIEISARSDYHGIDRLLLFEENISQNDAIDAADTFSVKTTCD